jgi:hypothetical protein
MTTFCKPIGRLRFAALFDGRLQKFGVYQRVVEGKLSETHQSLTDGGNIKAPRRRCGKNYECQGACPPMPRAVFGSALAL